MPTVSFKVSDPVLAQLKRDAEVQGVSVSELIRRVLQNEAVHLEQRVEDLERRISRLEGVAGFD